jgi:hypothetical protein
MITQSATEFFPFSASSPHRAWQENGETLKAINKKLVAHGLETIFFLF